MSRNIICLGLILIGALSLQAQDVVESQLDRINNLMKSDKFEATHDVEYDWLNDDESDNYYITLSEYYDYKIIAVCDEDCGDIDLKIFDDNGRLIDEDVEDDDVPILEVDPSISGRYRVQLKMYECDIEPCKVGIAIYGR